MAARRAAPKPRRVLVTGGAGFIGSTLVDRLLAEDHTVDVVDDLSTGLLANLAEARANPHHAVTFHHVDVRSSSVVELIARRRPEVIFHLAAQADVRESVARPVLDAEVNIIGTINVVEGAREAGTRKVVFAASGGTLYGEPQELPVRESHPHRPASPYGVSKKAAVDYLAAYRDLHGIEYTALALGNVYGPRQGGEGEGEAGVVSIFAARLLAGQPCTIFGDGEQTRDFVYVDDVVDAFARAASKGSGLLLNVGTGVETTINRLYDAMAAAAGVTAPPTYAPARPGELLRSALDPVRAAIHIGWKPWTGIDEGVRQLLDWYRRR